MKQRYSSLADYLAAGIETQEQLAARAGVTQPTISKAARGESCSLALAKVLSKLTGVPVDSFGREAVA
jgi:transcriptional regulator with XRE-family HTH domain